MTRIDYYKVAPEGVKAVRAVDRYVRASELEAGLIELVKVRASLMNGCASCVDLHTKDARAKGETEQRLFALPVWRETPTIVVSLPFFASSSAVPPSLLPVLPFSLVAAETRRWTR